MVTTVMKCHFKGVKCVVTPFGKFDGYIFEEYEETEAMNSIRTNSNGGTMNI